MNLDSFKSLPNPKIPFYQEGVDHFIEYTNITEKTLNLIHFSN